MQRFILVLFIASELCYYLLIAQTGIVEYFSSNIYLIASLPIGGVLGSFLSFYIKTSNSNKILFFLIIQLIMSFLYPQFSFIMLFILGISVGALAPLIINELKKATALDIGLSLSLSYVVGTFLFNYEASERGSIAIVLSLITLVCSRFLPKQKVSRMKYENYSLFAMVLWVFLDSALFESLSRDLSISIWRGGYSSQIALFHIVGVIAALGVKLEKNQKELLIMVLFAISYLLYFLREANILAIVYPFVISYYNVVILQTILKKDLKTISIYMVFIGWIASGTGLFVAVENLILFVPIIFLIAFFRIIISYEKLSIINKEIRHV
ncbi:hypothetical protein [Sulfurospirillum arcachonense]|uniref:hypothetical protein n=1 Tax=Sulfurospirillum arcachonense TaxID=57666 RepID=UPI000469CBBE|nr:hypothetical protein [Sulfurospirillum arcachonense]